MDTLRIDDLYSSGEYEHIAKAFELAARPDGRKPLIVFGPHRDDNFDYLDVSFMLNNMTSPEVVFADGTLPPMGHVMRGWYSSTFNRFVILFLAEIRTIICDQKKASAISKSANVSVGSVVTGLTAWLTTKFGLSDPVAVGIATAVLLSVVYATRGAFCKMTDSEVKAAMDKRVPRMD